MAIAPLEEHTNPHETAAKLNELIEAVNLIGETLATNAIVWGDEPKPSGWKW